MQPKTKTAPAIKTCGEIFQDTAGRQIIFHGINLVEKSKEKGYLSGDSPRDFEQIRGWGMNCVRLGIIWDGLEPWPGRIEESYLDGIDQRVAWAKENNLYVILDMHQDLYSSLYSDGAPAWATLTGGADHIVLPGVWSDAYFTSPAVQSALDNFWNNAPGPDGVGLQEHLAACWQAVAQRYTDEPAVIGYDLINEPFPGSSARDAQALLFERGAELLASIDPSFQAGAERLAQEWLDPAGRDRLLGLLNDAELYTQIIDVTQPIYAKFEIDYLMPFYRLVAEAIRLVDRSHILFIETSMGANMGVRSAIQPLTSSGGDIDPAQAYAPHGYDMVVDTPFLDNASAARVELIFQRHAETSRQLGLPMLVGEWGAFTRSVPVTPKTAWDISRQFQIHLCGDTYWHYDPELESFPSFQTISRPYPSQIAGKLLSYGYSVEEDNFSCSWEESAEILGPTLVFFPKWFNLSQRKLSLEPPGGDYRLLPNPKGVWCEINHAGRSQVRILRVG